MGRTKGSKNKPKIAKNPIEIAPTNSSNTINRFAKTDFEYKYVCTIRRFPSLLEHPSITTAAKNDFLILDTDDTLYLIRPDSKYYPELQQKKSNFS